MLLSVVTRTRKWAPSRWNSGQDSEAQSSRQTATAEQIGRGASGAGSQGATGTGPEGCGLGSFSSTARSSVGAAVGAVRAVSALNAVTAVPVCSHQRSCCSVNHTARPHSIVTISLPTSPTTITTFTRHPRDLTILQRLPICLDIYSVTALYSSIET